MVALLMSTSLIDRRSEAVDRVLVGDIGLDDQSLAVAGCDLLLHGTRLLDIALGDDDARTGGGERFGKTPPDALAGAGDDDDFVGNRKCFGHGSSSPLLVVMPLGRSRRALRRRRPAATIVSRRDRGR
jgi:hypothetical protein